MAEKAQLVTPYICCRNATGALEFYAKGFGARELIRFTDPGGKIGHAEIEIEGAHVMISDEWPEGGVFSPEKYGGTSCALRLVVADVDALAKRAVAAGATIERPPNDEPYGDRACWLRDPFGHRWLLATPIEQVSREELRRRMGDAFLVE
ncbi:MAG TPA: VOC family protein [Candidatus Binatia bacterium]|nr:VOC family protein [Candidatus Binatia bacterium]